MEENKFNGMNEETSSDDISVNSNEDNQDDYELLDSGEVENSNLTNNEDETLEASEEVENSDVSNEDATLEASENKVDDTIVDDTITNDSNVSEEEVASSSLQQALEEAKAMNQKKPKENKPSFFKKHKNGLVITACFALALAGGFIGTTLGNLVSGRNKAVLYQGISEKIAPTNTNSSGNMSVKEVAEHASNSVVEIKTESVSTNSFFQQAISSGAGSGVILTKDGYVVTNNHVISGANKIQVTTKDGKSYEAKLIGSDASSDLAILKIEANNLQPATLGTSESLQVGETAVAIGNPLGELGGTVTSGIISALDREITVDNQTMHLLQTSAAINPGNSGGGLFNDKGELIGVVNAKSAGDGIEGLGFAIPIDRAKPIIENLIQNGYVKGRASMGVTLTSSTGYSEDKTSIYISKINRGEAADRAGLKVGDQILKLDNQTINSVSDLKDVMNSHKAGDKVEIVVLRDSETKTLTITFDDANESMNNQANTPEDNQSGATSEEDIVDDFFDQFR